MKQTIRLTENELHQLVQDATVRYLNENRSRNYMNEGMNEDMDEGLLGMIGGRVARPLIKQAVNVIARMLNLDQNGVLYRVLTSRLFAMALGNELQNSSKLHRKEGEKPMNGLGGRAFDSNGDGQINLQDLLGILGIGRSNGLGSATTGGTATGGNAGWGAGGNI